LFSRKNKWLEHLNKHINVNLTDSLKKNLPEAIFLTIYQMYSNVSVYNYPDEDFCFFRNFPHSKLVLPRLKPNFKSSCSCTEIFLIQYSYKFSKYSDYYADSVTTFYPNLQFYSDEMFQRLYSNCINSSIDKVIKGKKMK